MGLGHNKLVRLLIVFLSGMNLWLAQAAQGGQVDLSLYGNLPAFEMAAISPNGSRVGLLATINDSRQILMLDNGKPFKRLAIADMKVVSLIWASEQLLLVRYRSTTALGLDFTARKAELESFMIIAVESGAIRDVFREDRQLTGGVQGFYGIVHRNQHVYGYFGSITLETTRDSSSDGYIKTTNPDLYEVELATGENRKIASRSENDRLWRHWAVTSAGDIAATLDYSTDTGKWKIYNKAHDVIAAGTTPNGDISLEGMGTSNDSIIYSIADADTGETHFMEANLSGAQTREIFADAPVKSLVFDAFSHHLDGYVTGDNQPRRVLLDPLKNKITKAIAKAFPDLNTTLISNSKDFRQHLVTTEGPGDAGTWWTVNIDTGSATELGHSYLIPGKDVCLVKMFAYQASDGLKMEGVLTLPVHKEPKNLPIIMLPHGGPYGVRDYPGFDWWAQAFAAQGYAVFQPNFRGSGGYGVDFEKAGYGQWGLKMQTDISDGLAELVKQGIADPKRVCIMGGSYGGYAALAGVTLQQGIYRCAVSVAGIGNLKAMYNTDLREAAYNQTLYRNLKEALGEYRNLDDVSPAKFADQADAPILLIHGKDDTRVAYSQSEEMAGALKKARKSVGLVTLDKEDHFLSKSTTRLQMLKAASEFIQKHNPAD